MRKLLLSFVWICLAITSIPITFAADAFTLEEFWRSPQFNGLTLSKSGKYLAATAPFNGRMNVVVIDLETREGTRLTSFEEFDVLNPTWVGDERIVFSLGQFNSPTGAGQFDGGGLYVVSRDGKKQRQLGFTVREARKGQKIYRPVQYFRSVPGSTDEIIVSGRLTSLDSVDLYRMNLDTGKTTLLTSGRPADRTGDWIMDSKLVPRVVTSASKDKPEATVYYRASADAPWKVIATADGVKGPVMVPLTFEADDQMMQVASNAGRDTMAVYRYDPNTQKLGKLIAEHPRFDVGAASSGDSDSVGGVLEEAATGRILGYTVNADKPESLWTDDVYAKTQAQLDKALPDTINSFRRIPNSKRLLVRSYSDVKSSRWYILDEEKKSLEEIASAKPWLDGKLVEQRPFIFKTRDGIEITGYYFLPRGYKPGTKLPTVVHIHGGPFARADSWGSGFGVAEGQMLASRGYAVVVPNFRITPGIGNKTYYAGFGTVGRQMSDDHEDALKWAVDQGFADARRACISGASYGGYAALQAMVKTPDLFKCAIAGLAVTDYEYQLTTTEGDTYNSESGVNYWKAVLGVKSLSEPIIREISPVYHADKIKGKVFLYAGRDDTRVPLDQISRMNKALIKAGNPPWAYVVKDKEGHGFGKSENRADLYAQVLKFLDEQLK